MKNINNNIFFSRNKELITDTEQEQLNQTTIAIAGAGGDGGLLAERLVRFGIKKIILADPESFEPTNINRQFAANQKNIGKNKAEAVADELLLINPNLEVIFYKEGITKKNVIEIINAADIVIDEIEYSTPALSVMLHRETRKQNKYLFMGANIGWGASIFCFSPDGKTFEQHFEYNEADATINPLCYMKEKPGYIKDELLQSVLSGNISMPSLSSSVGLVASVMANEIILFITGKRKPLIVPRFLFIDLFDLSIDKN
jgi:molybdopterin/thiamine biosynthesis adenylyltransferase